MNIKNDQYSQKFASDLSQRAYVEFVAGEANPIELRVTLRCGMGQAIDLLRIVNETDHAIDCFEQTSRLSLHRYVCTKLVSSRPNQAVSRNLFEKVQKIWTLFEQATKSVQ